MSRSPVSPLWFWLLLLLVVAIVQGIVWVSGQVPQYAYQLVGVFAWLALIYTVVVVVKKGRSTLTYTGGSGWSDGGDSAGSGGVGGDFSGGGGEFGGGGASGSWDGSGGGDYGGGGD